jgi:TolA-binding protein
MFHRLILRTATLALAAFAAGLAAEASAQNGGLPFSSTNTYRRPAVNPMTMMTMGGGGGGGGANAQGGMNPLAYQQLIQPRFDQESQIVGGMQQARQINNLQNRVQQIQRDTSSRQVNESIRPTGHSATYLNMSHYYPGGR